MSKRRIADESLFWFGVALIVTLGPAWNAHRPLEARPLQAGVQVGSGSVKGRVVDASSGRPVQGATVNVSVDGGRSKLASVVVGEDGSFAVDNIPPTESLLVRAVLSGYAGGIYGQRSPILSGDSAGVVSIRADDHLLDVTLPLWKYGSIAGTVTGESGGPAVGVTVRAWRQTYVGGHRALAEGFSPSGRTDERGQYRLAQVLPGSYVVGIPETVAPQSARFEAVTRTLFYPSTTNANDATAIDLSSSLDQTGIDFDETETAKASLWRISGDLEGWVSDRGPAVVDLTRQGHLGGPGTEVVTSTRSDPGNHFSFSRVPPGEYQIKVTSYPTWSPGTTGLLQGGSGLPPATPGLTLPAVPQGPTLWAAISVAVTDGDVTDVHVDLRAGARIRGAIQCDCGSVGLDEIAGRPVLVQATDGRDLGRFPVSRVEADGTFVTVGLPEGDYLIRPQVLVGRLTSVKVEGQEVIGRPIHVRTADVKMTIVLSTRETRLSGVVRDASGRPVANALVSLFPTDQSHWSDFGPDPTALILLARTNQVGAYTATVVPGIEYYLAASRSLPVDWKFADSFAQLVPTAIRVQPAAGQTETKDLTVR